MIDFLAEMVRSTGREVSHRVRCAACGRKAVIMAHVVTATDKDGAEHFKIECFTTPQLCPHCHEPLPSGDGGGGRKGKTQSTWEKQS